MSEKPKEIWIPSSQMTVTVDASGNVTLIETMDMQLKPIPPRPGFQPKDKP